MCAEIHKIPCNAFSTLDHLPQLKSVETYRKHTERSCINITCSLECGYSSPYFSIDTKEQVPVGLLKN